MESLSEQANSFALMIVAGVLVGLLFDFFRIAKGRLFSRRKVIAFFWDLLYCFLAAAIVYFGLIVGSWGELRFYLLVGTASGLLLYFILASRMVIRLLVWAFRGLAWVGQAIAAGVSSLYYHGVNLGVRLARRTGLDKVVRKGKRKVEVKQVNRPPLGKRLQRTARIFSARTRNLARGLRLSIKVKR